MMTYLRHVREEFSHITWPSQREATAHTLMIILISALVAIFVGLLDYGLEQAVSSIVGI